MSHEESRPGDEAASKSSAADMFIVTGEMFDLAEAALSDNQPRFCGHLLAVPDLVVLEGIANGMDPLPLDGPRVVRDDGRWVLFFTRPEAVTS